MFEARDAAAFDPERHVEIRHPRVQPGGEGPDHLELHFPMYFDGKRFYGISCDATAKKLKNGSDYWSLRFTTSGDIEALLIIKSDIAPELNDGEFIAYLAEGMTTVFADNWATPRTTTYEVFLSAAALSFARTLTGFASRPEEEAILSRRKVEAGPRYRR